MDKSEGKDWLSKTLNNVTEETAKVYRISKLKLEVNLLNKTYNEKMQKISRQLLKLIKQGDIDPALFEPEYSSLLQISAKLDDMNEEIDAIKNNLKFGFGKKKSDEKDEKIVDVKAEIIEDENRQDNK